MAKAKLNSHERAKKKMSESSVKQGWLSVLDAANYLGISKETVYRLLEREKIPSFKIGKLWKFKATDLDKWVQSGKSGTI